MLFTSISRTGYIRSKSVWMMMYVHGSDGGGGGALGEEEGWRSEEQVNGL